MHDRPDRWSHADNDIALIGADAPDTARLYDTPTAVVADPTLSCAQKLDFLHAWARDLAGDGNAASPDPVLLRLVRSAIADLEGQQVEAARRTRRWPRSGAC
jgi:hypothetical protein